MKFGLLLPHFGEFADRDRLISGAKRAEKLGFDSVWVRDHLAFEPHGEFEDPNRNFFETFTTLAVVGAVTERITLGTGALIPFRHPIHTAQIASAITHLVGDRLIIGFGGGNFDKEFEDVGLGGINRTELTTENIRIMRDIWNKTSVSRSDDLFTFEDVTLAPAPKEPIPIWWCGNTPASARRAVADCEGWLPGRIAIDTLAKRIEYLRELTAAENKPMLTVGCIPSVSIAKKREDALKAANVEGLLRWANNAKFWVKPPSGSFERKEDLGGVLLAGTPEDVLESCEELQSVGTDHVVFDLRMSFDRFIEQVDLLGEFVLPKMKK